MAIMVRAAFFFEPLAPTAISYYVGRKLNQWKNEGLISDYKTHTQRIGKFHYTVKLDMDLTSGQAGYVLEKVLPEQTRNLRRWLSVRR